GLPGRALSASINDTGPPAMVASMASVAMRGAPRPAMTGSYALIDGLSAQGEQRAGVAEVLGMAHEEGATGLHHPMDAFEHPALCRGIEIDHHVAAEHDVEGVAQRQLMDQVHVHEPHMPLQLWPHPDQTRVRPLAAHEKALQALLAQSLGVLGLVDAA